MQNIIFNILLLIIIIYIFFTNVENFQSTGATSGDTDKIKDLVKQVYLADVESIRNLSAVAKKLQEDGGLVTPANMSIRGKVTINSPTDAKSLPANVTMTIDNPTETTLRLKTKADDAKNVTLTNNDGNLQMGNPKGADLLNIKSDGNVAIKQGLTTGSLTASSLTSGTLTTTGDMTCNTNLTGQNIRANNNLAVGNTLIGKDIQASGTITGTIITGTINNTRNRARYIIVGNHKRPDLAIDSWSLIEAEVYDINGVNIAKGKQVSIVKGAGGDTTNYPPSKITDGQIFTNRSFGDNMINGYYGTSALSQGLEIDLGADYDLSQIVLFNRFSEPISSRLNGTTIELVNSAKIPVRLIQTGIWNNIYSKEYTL